MTTHGDGSRPALRVCLLGWRPVLAGLGHIAFLSLSAHAAQPDLILLGCKIVTVDEAFSLHEAIAVQDGQVLQVAKPPIS